MQVDSPRRLEYPAQFNEARSHHRKVGKHIVLAEEGSEGHHHLCNLATLFDYFLKRLGRRHVPMPSILKGLDLGGSSGPVLLSEKDVVILIGTEGGGEVNKVDGLIFHI